MSQKSQAQILTDLQKIYSHLAESADRIDTLARRVDAVEACLRLAQYDGARPITPAPAKQRCEVCWRSDEAHKHMDHDHAFTAPPEAGKRWTLHTDLKGTPTTVCYDSVGCPVPKHVEVVPAADLDAARESLDAARQVSVNLRDRLEAAEAREKEPPYCCDLLECPTHGFAIKEKE